MADMPPLVMIEWTDGRQPVPGWQRLSDLDSRRANKCISIGFLVREDEHTKVLAPNLGSSGDEGWDQASGLMSIPVAAITKQRTISPFHLTLATATPAAQPRPLADAPWLRRLA